MTQVIGRTPVVRLSKMLGYRSRRPTRSLPRSSRRCDRGRITADPVPRMMERAAEYAAEPDTYWTNQLHNCDSIVGYRQVGDELLEQLDRQIDVFCAAVGTAGLVMGVSAALSDAGSPARIVVFEPATTAVISGGEPGVHRVEGIGIGFRPPLLDADRFDEARPIAEPEARAMARRLAAEEGLLVGTSTGLNVTGAVELATQLGPGHTLGGDLFDLTGETI